MRNCKTRGTVDRLYRAVPLIIVLLLVSSSLAVAADGGALSAASEKASTAAAEAGKKLEQAGAAADSKLQEVWRRIDEKRLKNRTPDELAAWAFIGLLVGGFVRQFTRVNLVVALLLGLAGSFIGGIVANVTGLNIGMGPVLVRYEEVLASLAGGFLFVLAARRLGAKRQPEQQPPALRSPA